MRMNDLLQNKIHLNAQQSAILFLEEFENTDFIGPTIESIVEFKKISLIYDTINDPESEGFSALKQATKFIFINSNFNLRLQKFTIVHEIYHLDDNIAQFENSEEDERAADHFAANLLLPEKVVFDKQRTLNKLGYNDIEVFFALADLSQVPYEALYKRYQELNISRVQIDKELKLIKLDVRNPYLEEREQELQVLRKKSALGVSELDQPTYKQTFKKLETLIGYYNQREMVAKSE